MLDALREARGYVQGKARIDLDRDTMLLRAVVNCIGIVGEAASHISEETRTRASGIPWAQVTGMRNRLVHAYFDISRDVVWTTVTHDLAVLERQLSTILDAENHGA
jgi:uncharacterized protein with HEPN domain